MYLFKHVLVQDAAYSTLLRGARQTLHTRIAAVLEQHFADIVQAQPEVWPATIPRSGSTARESPLPCCEWVIATRYKDPSIGSFRH